MADLILHEEENVVSLRTAFVLDDGDLVSFRLMPASIPIPNGRSWWAPKDFEWATQDSAWLYRHMRSSFDEATLMHGQPCIQQDVRPMVFQQPPQFNLLWSDSGSSVALCLNAEPWAFILEQSHKGYSKGLLRAAIANPWDEDLFERSFGR